ncbi:MAG: NADAR family protein [Ruminococcus sp.]|nr:NADAR family protein [Ruminococcus sp.]
MKYTRENIPKNAEFLFFWGHRPASGGKITKSCLSQWFECEFTADGVKYHTAEQYMMAQKALLFGDNDVFELIMKADDPKEYKSLGRKIRNFDDKLWNDNRTDIVIKGNIAKFSQNKAMKNFLLDTADKVLVEASPVDCIWGIGLSADAPDASKPEKWRGSNLLGFCLMEVRDKLSEDEND